MKRKITQQYPDGFRGTLRALVGGALIAGAALAAPAQAGVITFDDQFGLVGDSDVLQEAGYTVGFFSNSSLSLPGEFVGLYADGTDASSCISASCPTGNASTYYAAVNDSFLAVVGNDGGAFSVKSFDSGFIGSYAAGSAYPSVPGLLRVLGVFADGTSTSETYQLSGTTSGNFSFDHFAPTAAFSALQFVQVYFYGFACGTDGNCQAFQTNRGQFGIDNIELISAASGEVPEPGSALLVSLGLMGLGVSARARRKA